MRDMEAVARGEGRDIGQSTMAWLSLVCAPEDFDGRQVTGARSGMATVKEENEVRLAHYRAIDG